MPEQQSAAKTTREERQDIMDGLFAAAKAAAKRAYAPYSRFRVGAALETDGGVIYTGCNVENASFGLTVCAERVAIFNAVNAESGRLDIRALAVFNEEGAAAAPCGACRQVISEFGADATIAFFDGKKVRRLSFRDLLPYGFSLPA